MAERKRAKLTEAAARGGAYGDDTANALVQRLASYHEQTVPVLQHYKPRGVVVTANANQAMDAVWDELEAGLSRASA